MTSRIFSPPQRIWKMFDGGELSKARGRAKVMKWLRNRYIKEGDVVLLPEIGWTVKTKASTPERKGNAVTQLLDRLVGRR